MRLSADNQDMGPGLPDSGPPPYFDPTTASDADLACWGFPPRPMNDPQQLANWTKAMELNRPEYWVHAKPEQQPVNPAPMVRHQITPQSVVNNTYENANAGFIAVPGSADNNYPFYLNQGAWLQQGPALNDGHLILDWTGLTANSVLYQAGTELKDPPSGGGAATYNFFYEVYVNQYGQPAQVAPAPLLHVGDSVAAVVDLTLGQIPYFEVCDYTGGSQCSWYPDSYQNPPTYANIAYWVMEDSSAATLKGVPYSKSYNEVNFGPYSGNQNIVDDPYESKSYGFDNLPDYGHFMGPSLQTNYMGPGPIRIDTYFNICPGLWYQGGPNPTC